MNLVDTDKICNKWCGLHNRCNPKERRSCAIGRMPMDYDIDSVLSLLDEIANNCKTEEDLALIEECIKIVYSGFN